VQAHPHAHLDAVRPFVRRERTLRDDGRAERGVARVNAKKNESPWLSTSRPPWDEAASRRIRA
jgi:hypothetical protein